MHCSIQRETQDAHADVMHEAQAMHALDVADGREEEDLGDRVAAVALSHLLLRAAADGQLPEGHAPVLQQQLLDVRVPPFLRILQALQELRQCAGDKPPSITDRPALSDPAMPYPLASGPIPAVFILSLCTCPLSS